MGDLGELLECFWEALGGHVGGFWVLLGVFCCDCVLKREIVKSVVLRKEIGWMGSWLEIVWDVFCCLEVFGSWLKPGSEYFGGWKTWKLENGG